MTSPANANTPRDPARLRRALPNALTLARLALAVAVVALLSGVDAETPGNGLLAAAFVLFCVAAATDAIDGFLARRWGVVSVFGRVMDPFADKLLVIGTLVVLAGPGFAGADHHRAGFTPWMVVAILGRDLLVTSIRGVYEAQGIDFSAGASGKAKMVVQSVAVPLVLLLLAIDPQPDPGAHAAIRVAAWATVITTLWSALPYVLRARAEAPPNKDLA